MRRLALAAAIATGMWLTTRDSTAKTSKVAPPAKG